MAVIDLDLSAEPAPSFKRMRIGPVILLCGLLLLGAPDVKPKPWAQQLAEIHVRQGSVVSLAGPDFLVTVGGLVVAYDVATAKERWRNETGLGGVSVWYQAGLLLGTGADAFGLDAGLYHPYSIAIDPETGVTLWRAEGSLIFLPNGELPLLNVNPLVLNGDTTLSLLRKDGTAIWTLQAGPIAPAIDEHRGVVAVLDRATGELVERDVLTFAERRRTILPGAQDAEGLFYYDGTLTVFHSSQVAYRYDVETLVPLPIEPPGQVRVDCGIVWCVINEDRLVDKVTGETVYTTRGVWAYAVTTGAGVLGLGVVMGDGEPVIVREIVDPRTRKAIDMTGWVALNLSIGSPVAATQRAIVLAYKGDRLAHLALFDDNGLHQLGVLSSRDLAQCVLADQTLACRVGADLVRVWRLT